MTWIETTDGEWLNSERIIGFAIEPNRARPGFLVMAHTDGEHSWQVCGEFGHHHEARVWLREWISGLHSEQQVRLAMR